LPKDAFEDLQALSNRLRNISGLHVQGSALNMKFIADCDKIAEDAEIIKQTLIQHQSKRFGLW